MNFKENAFLERLQIFIDKSTKAAGLLIFVIVFAVAAQVFSRFALNKFILEIVPLVQQSFAVFLLIGGAYITSRGDHIRVTVLFDLFGPRMKRFSKIVSLICMLIFMGILTWQTSWMGLNSLSNKETMNGLYKFMPMYPLKLFIPVMAIFILIVGVISFLKTWKSDN